MMHKINETPGEVSFFKAYKDFFTGCLDFKGRSSRAGYWWICLLFSLIIEFYLIAVFVKLSAIISGQTKVNIYSIYILSIVDMILLGILFIPGLAVTVRRYRDVGVNGKATAIFLIMFALIGTYVGFRFGVGSVVITVIIFSIVNLLITVLPANRLTTESQNAILRFCLREKNSL